MRSQDLKNITGNRSRWLTGRLSVGALLILTLAASCVPRQLKPVDAIDPKPLLDTVYTRQAAYNEGLSGTLEMAFRGKKRFNGKVYIVAYPDGRFRLEVPGPFGGTQLVMANDNTDILIYYPGENKAFRSAIDGRALDSQLPFPLPTAPERLPALIMGVLPPVTGISGVNAHIMNSGERQLQATVAESGLQFTYLFEKGPGIRLRRITASGEDIRTSINTRRTGHFLPEDINLTARDSVLKGEWDSLSLFKGQESVLEIPLPHSVPVTVLEPAP